jgi:hypothetical protein
MKKKQSKRPIVRLSRRRHERPINAYVRGKAPYCPSGFVPDVNGLIARHAQFPVTQSTEVATIFFVALS